MCSMHCLFCAVREHLTCGIEASCPGMEHNGCFMPRLLFAENLLRLDLCRHGYSMQDVLKTLDKP